MSPLKVLQSGVAKLPGLRTVKLIEAEHPNFASFPKIMTGDGLRAINLVDPESEYALQIRAPFRVGDVRAWGDSTEPDEFDFFLWLDFNNPIYIDRGDELVLPELTSSERTGTRFNVHARTFDEGDEGFSGYNCRKTGLGMYVCPEHPEYRRTRQQFRDGDQTCQIEEEEELCELELEYEITDGVGLRHWDLGNIYDDFGNIVHKCRTLKFNYFGVLIDPMASRREGYEGVTAPEFYSEWTQYWGCLEHPDVFITEDEYDAMAPEERVCPVCGEDLVHLEMRWVVVLTPEERIYPELEILLTSGTYTSVQAAGFRCAEKVENEEEEDEWEYTMPTILDKTMVKISAQARMEIREVVT